MNARPKPTLTVAEYLAIERRAETKSEFYGGEVFPLAAASLEHQAVKENLVGKLRPHFKDGHIFFTGRRLQLGPDGAHAYPDIVIVSAPPGPAVGPHESLADPQIIIEVLDHAAERNEYGWKYHCYMHSPTVREYVLVSTDEMRIVRFARESADTWRTTDFIDPDGEFALATCPVRITLRDIYAGVPVPAIE